LFAVGCEDDPDFSGANPTVYTNLWLQIKSKLLAGETGSEPRRRIYFTAFSARHSWRSKHFCLTAAADIAVTGRRFFAGRLEDVGNIPSEARLISHSVLLVLVLVIVLEGKQNQSRAGARARHGTSPSVGGHDYDAGGPSKWAACP